MNDITLRIELGPDTQAKLDQILEVLRSKEPNCHSCVETAVAMTKDMVNAEPTTCPEPETGEPVQPVEAGPSASEPEETKWSKDDLQHLVQKLAVPETGKRDRVRAIVKSYAEKVGDIPSDKYAEVMDKLIALDKEG